MIYHFDKGTESRRAQDIERVCNAFHNLPLMQSWRIEVREYRSQRSEQQNRYLWSCVYQTFLDTGQLQGWDKDDLHEYFLGEWSGWEVLEGMGRKRMKPLRRSSRLNKTEFGEYVAFIQRKGAEMGVIVPDPEPKHG